jgi:hypothetical protein
MLQIFDLDDSGVAGPTAATSTCAPRASTHDDRSTTGTKNTEKNLKSIFEKKDNRLSTSWMKDN